MDYKEYAKLNNIDLNENDPVFAASTLITEARLYADMSQAELAKKIGTQQPSIARAEKGAVVPSIDFLQKIAKAIGTYLVPPKFGFMVDREKIPQVYFFQNYDYSTGFPSPIKSSIKTEQYV